MGHRIGMLAILGLAAVLFARTHAPEDSMDAVKGVRIAGRIACDGSTNFRDEVSLKTTYSPGGSERAFHLDEFQAQYCRHADLYFICLKKGHDRWKEVWSSDSSRPTASPRAWLDSCSEWESKQAPQYLLSGWYRESGNSKLPWSQATLKKVSSNPDVYEFADAHGGTARLELQPR